MKNKKRHLRKFLLISFLAVFFSFVVGSSALAAEEVKKSTGPSVSPPIINLSLKAGSTTKGTFAYTNNSDTAQTISLDLRPFVPSEGTKGSPVFTDANGKAITSPLKDWISLNKTSYDVPAGGKAEISFNVKAPSTAEAKKYYVAIVAGEKKSATTGSGSTISTEIGVLVVADVTKASTSVVAKVKGYPWYFYAMIVVFVIAVLLAIVIYKRRD